jgi:PEGA domain
MLLAVLWCITGRVAHAGPGSALVLVVGKAPAKDRATVAAAVRSAARSGGWSLFEAPLSEPEATSIVGCLKAPQRWACVSPLTAGKGIERLIVVDVEPERTPEDRNALTLTEQILVAGSDVTSADRRPCPQCTDEVLARITFDLTKGLLEEAAAGTGRTRLRVMSTPPGAWITLDNTSGGLTDHTYSTFPGRHVVIVQRDGYQIETRNVDAVENQETLVAFTLRPKDPPVVTPPTSQGTDHPHLVPGLIIGAGAAAVVVGVVLQFPPDTGKQPKYLINAPGAIAVVGGAAAIGVGVYLWGRATRNTAPRSMPTATVTNGGGIVGWTGQF